MAPTLSAIGAHGGGTRGTGRRGILAIVACVALLAGCAESPDGAQAFHWLNESLVDGKVELLKPELLMFEPQPNGSMQLIGVDYVVPLTASATAPTLLGVPFARNEPLGVWALHIWAWRPNPSGMFAAWNPKVSCRYAKTS